MQGLTTVPAHLWRTTITETEKGKRGCRCSHPLAPVFSSCNQQSSEAHYVGKKKKKVHC